MRRNLLILFVVIFSTFITTAHAQKRSYKSKTVHVRSYTTKKGKHVNSYRRSKPGRRTAYYMIEGRREDMDV